MISIFVQCGKIDPERLYKSEKTGKRYLNLILLEQRDEYGNLVVIQPVTKQEFTAGRRGEVVGRWKEVARKCKIPPNQTAASEELGF